MFRAPVPVDDKCGAGSLWDRVLDFIFPPHCVACGCGGAWLCDRCLDGIAYLDLTRDIPGVGVTTVALGTPPPFLHEIRSVAWHQAPLRQAVHAIKYEGATVLQGVLGEILADYWQRLPLVVDVIVPVPLHPSRQRQRGYNQSELLAKAFGEQVGLPVHVGSVERRRNTRAQVGLSRTERLTNVEGAFICRNVSLDGQRVLLIDDVYTTGATLSACAHALRLGGAASVSALTLTRALGDPDS